MSEQLTLIARLTAKADQSDALGDALLSLVEPTLREEGAIEYRVHRDLDDPAIWYMYETWRGRSDLDGHFAQPYTAAVLARFPEWLAAEMELFYAGRKSPAN